MMLEIVEECLFRRSKSDAFPLLALLQVIVIVKAMLNYITLTLLELYMF